MSGILLGLGQLFQPIALIALLAGVVIGLIVGSLPGLNDSHHLRHGATGGDLPVGWYLLCFRLRRFRSLYSVKDSGNCLRYGNRLRRLSHVPAGTQR